MTENSCDLDDFNNASSGANASFSSNPSSAVLSCQQAPTLNVPCDLDEMSVTSIAGSRTTSYRFQGGNIVADQSSSSNDRSLYATRSRERLLQMTAAREDAGGTQALVQVVVRPISQGCCGEHPLATVNSPGGSAVEHRGSDALQFEFPVWHSSRALNSRAHWLLERYWSLHLPPNVWLLVVDTCGAPAIGPAFHGASYHIEVFPDDQYTLQISVPSMRRIRHSRQATRNLANEHTRSRSDSDTSGLPGNRATSGRTSSQTTNDRGATNRSSNTYTDRDGAVHTVTQEDSYSYNAEHHEIEARRSQTTSVTQGVLTESQTQGLDGVREPVESTWAPPSDQVSVVFKRNGDAQDASVNITAIVNSLRYLENSLRELRNFIENWIPQAGWRFVWDISFCSGSMQFTWGWKEHSDHQAFMAWSGGLDMQIINASLELSFGFAASSAIEARVAGRLNGFAALRFSGSRTSPDSDLLPNAAAAEVSTLIQAGLEVQASAGIPGFRYEFAAGASSGLDVNAGLRAERSKGIYLQVKVEWTGILLYQTSTDPRRSSRRRQIQVMDKSVLYDDVFPAQ